MNAIDNTDSTTYYKNVYADPPPIETAQKSIDYIMMIIHRINLHPQYQRDAVWPPEKFCSFLTSLYYNGHAAMTLTLCDTMGQDNKYEYETIDGQHRLLALWHFRHSKPLDHIKNIANNMVYININGSNAVLFYDENEHTKAWCKLNSRNAVYMTSDKYDPYQRKKFLGINLIVVVHKYLMTDAKKKAAFISLQQGVKVTNSDLYRNMELPLLNMIYNEKLEDLFKNMLNVMSVAPVKYRIQFLVRLYHISSVPTNIYDHMFTMTDSVLTKALKKGDSKYFVIADDKCGTKFTRDMERMVTFAVDHEDKNVKLPPIAFYAIFCILSSMTDEEYIMKYPIIKSYTSSLTSDGFISSFFARVDRQLEVDKKIVKTLWERKNIHNTIYKKRNIYQIAFDLLTSYTVPLITKPKISRRKPLSKYKRGVVWKRCFGEEATEAICGVCKTNNINLGSNGFHVGHIVAHSEGGTDNFDNLLPICAGCNRDMGTQSLYDYKSGL